MLVASTITHSKFTCHNKSCLDYHNKNNKKNCDVMCGSVPIKCFTKKVQDYPRINPVTSNIDVAFTSLYSFWILAHFCHNYLYRGTRHWRHVRGWRQGSAQTRKRYYAYAAAAFGARWLEGEPARRFYISNAEWFLTYKPLVRHLPLFICRPQPVTRAPLA